MRKMTILQGLPGSGKSTRALALATESLMLGLSCVILSTDNFFIQDGKYIFDGSKIPAAHTWNQDRAILAAERGIHHILIDNTNMQAWEAKPYVLIAAHSTNDYEIEFSQAVTPWQDDPAECARRCSHGVPLDAIVAMQARRHQLSVEVCAGALAPWEKA